MAQRVIIEMIDDLDGTSEAAETVTFGLDGVTYELDLSEKNAAKLRKSMESYVAHARRVSGKKLSGRKGGGSSSSSSSTGSGPTPSVVRAWAKENGHDVPDRGRIPAEITEAYLAAS